MSGNEELQRIAERVWRGEKGAEDRLEEWLRGRYGPALGILPPDIKEELGTYFSYLTKEELRDLIEAVDFWRHRREEFGPVHASAIDHAYKKILEQYPGRDRTSVAERLDFLLELKGCLDSQDSGCIRLPDRKLYLSIH